MSQAQLIDTCMTAAEARACIEQMKTYAHRFRALALELYERGGWRALGYASWRACAVQEFGLSQPRVYQLLVAAQVERNISTIVEIGTLPEFHLRPLTRLDLGLQREAYQAAVETAPDGKITAAHVDQVVREFKSPAVPLANHQLINASTNNEWYTPRRYLDAVHAVMGGIDLDPASNAIANKNVRAAAYYTIDDDGFTKEWRGRVWLNPPYGKEAGKSNQARWSRRLLEQYRAGTVTQAVLLVNAVPSNTWFAPLWDFPICFTDHRIRFDKAEDDRKDPTHSNALVYLGPNVQRFDDVFSAFGVVAVRRRAARLLIADEVAA